MRYLLVAILLTLSLSAEDRWLIVKSGPFEVYSAAGDKAARDRLNDLEQFREGLSNTIGKKDLKLIWPLRVIVFKKQTPVPGQIAMGRDGYMAAVTESSGLPTTVLKELTRLFIDQNSSRLPEEVENGLITLFSTLEVSATHITLGTPVQPSERTRDWARMHMLTVDPNYSGRTRVMISNLEQSNDIVAAYHNAFEKTPAQIDQALDAYVKAGQFGTTTVSGRTINPARDFHVWPLESDGSKLAHADLMLSANSLPEARTEYGALHGPEAAEGLGMIELKNGKKDEAKRMFTSAAEAGSKSASLWLNLALLETDAAKSRTDLHKAADLNIEWGEPWRQLANYDTNPAQKIADLKQATKLNRRNIEYWQELARVATAANQFGDAAKAWSGAERAAANEKEREDIRATRLKIEGERSDFEAAERKRKAEEEAREIDRVKQANLAEIRAAEDAARKNMNPNGQPIPTATVWMDELNGSGKVSGTLQRFDCIGHLGRLVIQTPDGKTTQIAVRDPAKVGLSGAEKMMACGPQKPPRRVVVQFIAQPDKKLATVGDATIIELH